MIVLSLYVHLLNCVSASVQVYLHATFRFIQYNPTSLERSHKHDHLTEVDLGVPIDLILPETYSGTDSTGRYTRAEVATAPGPLSLILGAVHVFGLQLYALLCYISHMHYEIWSLLYTYLSSRCTNCCYIHE